MNVAPPPHALIHAQDKLVMRRALEALGRTGPAVRRGDGAGRRRRVRGRASAGRSCVKTARGGYDGRGVILARDLDEARSCREQLPRRRRPGARRGAGGDATRTGGAGGPLAVRPGRGVADRGDGAARRHLRRGHRARARSGRRTAARQSSWRCGWPSNSGWSACWPSNCSRPPPAR